MHKIDTVTRAPDLTGSSGRAWRIDINALRTNCPPNPGAFACLAMWCIEAPWAHPFWHSYTLAVSHLRDVDGSPAPEIVLEGATHQFWLYAMNPERSREAHIAAKQGPALMTPMNFSAQFIAADDVDAIATLERSAVMPILEGNLSPDTYYMHQWIARFGDNMVKPEYRVTHEAPRTVQ